MAGLSPETMPAHDFYSVAWALMADDVHTPFMPNSRVREQLDDGVMPEISLMEEVKGSARPAPIPPPQNPAPANEIDKDSWGRTPQAAAGMSAAMSILGGPAE